MEKSIKQILTEKLVNSVKEYEAMREKIPTLIGNVSKTDVLKRHAVFSNMQYHLYDVIILSDLLNEIFKEDISQYLSKDLVDTRRVMLETIDAEKNGKLPKELEELMEKLEQVKK